MDANELLKRYASGERFFEGANLFCTELKNADLNSANFLCTSFYFADLSKANLSKTNLCFADLTGAILTGANLLYADLTGAKLRGAEIDETTKIEPKWHLVCEVASQKANKHNLAGVDLSQADLSGVNLSGANLTGANLSETNLQKADLSGAFLYKSNLSRAILYQTNLRGANLQEANLRGAYLSETNLSRANLSEADLRKVFLCGSDLSAAKLTKADLYEAELREVDLSRAILNFANLSRADLRRAKLDSAKLSGTFLYEADLRGIDLEDVVLNEAKTDGLILDNKVNFNEELISLSNHVRKAYKYVSNEVQTKTSLILPFINLLGYDIHNPCEVCAEYIADFAVRRSGRPEQVDYALFINEIPVIFIEAKKRTEKPETHDGQLRRYFATSIPTKIGIVTNGINYNFFTDIDNKNIMDKNPFFLFNILNYSSRDVEVLKLFIRDNFNIGNPLELLYNN